MIRRFVIRLWYSWRLRSPEHRELSFYEGLWCGSPLIYLGPVGAGAILHPEARAFERVVDAPAIADSELVNGLAHPDGTFAAYCFEILVYRNSPVLANLPPALYERCEPVSMGVGCIHRYLPLGEYVRRRLTATRREAV